MKDLTRICAADVANVGSDISRLRGFVDSSYAQFALLGVQLMWTTDVQSALEQVSSALSKKHSLWCTCIGRSLAVQPHREALRRLWRR